MHGYSLRPRPPRRTDALLMGKSAISTAAAVLSDGRLGGRAALARRLTLNGLPGLLSLGADGALQTLSVEIAAGRVVAVYMTRNPHKLAHLRAYLPENAPAPPS